MVLHIEICDKSTSFIIDKTPFVQHQSSTDCFIIIATISHRHFPGRGRGGRGTGRGDTPEDIIPPPYTGQAEGTANPEWARQAAAIAAALRELSQIWIERGHVDPSHNTIPTREDWDWWIELRLQETFQEPSTPDHLDWLPSGCAKKKNSSRESLKQEASFLILILFLSWSLPYYIFSHIYNSCVCCKIEEKGNFPRTILPIE